MRVTIFIPIFNPQCYLQNLISSLSFFLDRDLFNVLFVDSSTSDESFYILKNAGFFVHKVGAVSFDHGGTRSLAKDLCYDDIVIYLTQDALPLSVDDIARLVAVFDDDTIGAAYGRQLPYEETNLFGKHLRQFNYTETSYIRSLADKEQYGIKTAFLSNSFAAYRRTAMDQIGWFKDGLILGEDTFAGAKLLQEGYKLAYVADAQVYHSHSYTIWEEFKRYFDIGVFHQMESWILKEFGQPEGEGMRYIKSEFKFLLANKAYHLILEFFMRNSMKFLGYKMGKYHSKLSIRLIKKLSMHHRWWDKYEGN